VYPMKSREVLDRVAAVLQRQPRPLAPQVASSFVQEFLARRETFLELAATHGSPQMLAGREGGA